MALAGAIKRPQIGLYVLCHIDLPKLVRNFVQDSTWTQLGWCYWDRSPSLVIPTGPVRNTELSIATTVIGCAGTSNSYYWDGTKLYVNLASSYSNFATHYVKVYVRLKVGTVSKIVSGSAYEPRIISAPSISMRVEEAFGAPVQIGGGNLKIANADGEFDDLRDWQWESADVYVYAGADTVQAESTEMVRLGVWGVDQHSFDDESIDLRLRDSKRRADASLPVDTFNLADFPSVSSSSLGDAVPIAYGRIQSVEPVCIDTVNKVFLLAGHPIFSITGCRVEIDGGWKDVTPASFDLNAGTITLGADWTGSEAVSVDFIGRKTDAGLPMLNPVDIVEDILTQAGAADAFLNFSAAKAALEPLTDEDGNPAPLRQIALYLNESTDVMELLGTIARCCGISLYQDTDGRFTAAVWQPKRSDGVIQFDEQSIIEFIEDFDSEGSGVQRRVIYQNRPAEDFSQIETSTRVANEYTSGAFGNSSDDIESPLVDIGDARALGQSELFMNGQGHRTWQMTVTWLGWGIAPTDCVRIKYTDRHNVDTVAEVYEARYDLGNGTVTLKLGNQRNFAGSAGFWVGDSDALPTRFSALAGYGAGGLAWNDSWHPDIKRWARENVGYWTDENGFASVTDPDSYIPSSWS